MKANTMMCYVFLVSFYISNNIKLYIDDLSSAMFFYLKDEDIRRFVNSNENRCPIRCLTGQKDKSLYTFFYLFAKWIWSLLFTSIFCILACIPSYFLHYYDEVDSMSVILILMITILIIFSGIVSFLYLKRRTSIYVLCSVTSLMFYLFIQRYTIPAFDIRPLIHEWLGDVGTTSLDATISIMLGFIVFCFSMISYHFFEFNFNLFSPDENAIKINVVFDIFKRISPKKNFLFELIYNFVPVSSLALLFLRMFYFHLIDDVYVDFLIIFIQLLLGIIQIYYRRDIFQFTINLPFKYYEEFNKAKTFEAGDLASKKFFDCIKTAELKYIIIIVYPICSILLSIFYLFTYIITDELVKSICRVVIMNIIFATDLAVGLHKVIASLLMEETTF